MQFRGKRPYRFTVHMQRQRIRVQRHSADKYKVDGTPILLACDFTQNVPGVNAQVQFFHQLAFQTLGGGFVRFEFAARKLPQPFQPSGSAADEHAPIRPDPPET